MRARALGASKMCPFRFACRNGGYKIMSNYVPFLKQIGPDREMCSDRMSGREARRIFFCSVCSCNDKPCSAHPLGTHPSVTGPILGSTGRHGLDTCLPMVPFGLGVGRCGCHSQATRRSSGCRKFRCRVVRVAKKALTPTFRPGSEREIL